MEIKMGPNEEGTEPWTPNDCRIWEYVHDNYSKGSPIRLKCLDPHILGELLNGRNLILIQKYYRYFEEIATIRRSASSCLPLTDDNGVKGELSLAAIMPDVKLKTLIVKHKRGTDIHDPEDERSEYLAWHNTFAT